MVLWDRFRRADCRYVIGMFCALFPFVEHEIVQCYHVRVPEVQLVRIRDRHRVFRDPRERQLRKSESGTVQEDGLVRAR